MKDEKQYPKGHFIGIGLVIGMLILMGLAGENLFAQVPATTQEKQLEQEVDSLRHEIKSYNERLNKLEQDFGVVGAIFFFIFFLYGLVCALWAQNTGRNAWLWFWLGMCLNVIAVCFLLCSKNSKDRRLVAERNAKVTEASED